MLDMRQMMRMRIPSMEALVTGIKILVKSALDGLNSSSRLLDLQWFIMVHYKMALVFLIAWFLPFRDELKQPRIQLYSSCVYSVDCLLSTLDLSLNMVGYSDYIIQYGSHTQRSQTTRTCINNDVKRFWKHNKVNLTLAKHTFANINNNCIMGLEMHLAKESYSYATCWSVCDRNLIGETWTWDILIVWFTVVQLRTKC